MKTKYSLPTILVSFAFLVAPLGMGAQEAPTGLLSDPARYDSLAVLPQYHPGEKADEVRISVDLRPFCPVAGNQGETGSCVGWAVGYGAMTINRAINTGLQDRAEITQQANSAAFIYNQIKVKEDCLAGAYIEDALKLVQEVGDCLERDFNLTSTNCAASATLAFREAASLFKISNFAAVFPIDADSRVKTARVCEVLNANKPVIVGMDIGPSFWKLLPGSRLWKPSTDEKASGKHAMVVVGYDQIEKQFTLLNSFGSTWGDNGFIQISFADFNRLCNYGYVLITEPIKETATVASVPMGSSQTESYQFGGEFVFRRPAGYLTNPNGKRVPFFEEVATLRDGSQGLYVPKLPIFSVGDVFQLVARNLPAGFHVYVFSQQSDGVTALHFPKISPRRKEADFMLADYMELVIPSEETVLQLNRVGADYLGVVYSARPIENIEARLTRITQREDDFLSAAKAAFQDVLLPEEFVQYLPNSMAFRAQTALNREQTAVGLFLRIIAE